VQFREGGYGEGNGLTGSFGPGALTGGFGGGGRNRPTYDLINTWEAGDLRFKASMDTMYYYFNADSGRYITVTDTVPGSHGRRFINKYLDTLAVQPYAGDADNNFVVLRYADVLLMLAEALGGGTEAYGLINQVRNRAGLANVTSYTDLGYASFEDFLLHERRVELAFENHRWYDLLRFGKALDVITAHFATEPPILSAPAEYRMLSPIPQREVDLGLVQNPGY
ncbi:MAG: RagB/SusD family nutrient uptake outer membrane protein, partial [Candidatus Neomarinimicrobiota bacterium]